MRTVVVVLVLGACASAGKDGGGGGGGGVIDAPAARVDAPEMTLVDASMPDAASATCATAATCAGAMMLGSVSGDTGNAKLSASGYQSAWYRVRVTEDDSDVFGLTLRVGANLTLPAGGGFEVFLYLNSGSDVVECTTPTGSATVSGNVHVVRTEWGEGTFSNGSDDSRSASIEVRPTGTTCSPAQSWSLEVEGDWL